MWSSKYFKVGRVVWTHTINAVVADNSFFAKDICAVMERYCSKDWGDLSECDKKANDSAVIHTDDRIFASYNTSEGKIYVITEADRSVTTIMFASEY